MRCPRCQFDNPPAMNFRVECGTKLGPFCPHCGAEAQPTFKFCGQRGAALEVPELVSEKAPVEKAQLHRRQGARLQNYTPRHLAEKSLTSRRALEPEAAGNLAPAPDSATLASLHAKHAAVLTVLVEVEAAEAAYQQTLELARRVGGRRRETETLARLGNMHNSYHREVPAMQYNEQALAVARELHDRAFRAVCLANRVYIRSGGLGEIIEATSDVEAGIRSKEIGDPKLPAQPLPFLGGPLQWRAELVQQTHEGFSFGVAAFSTGHANTAKGEYEEALRRHRRLRPTRASTWHGPNSCKGKFWPPAVGSTTRRAQRRHLSGWPRVFGRHRKSGSGRP